METNPSKLDDALETTHPEQFECRSFESGYSAPEVQEQKLDPNQPQVWCRVPGGHCIPNLPKLGDIRVEWHMTISNSLGVIHTSDEVHTKRGIDGPNQAGTVATSIQKVLEGGLYEPMIADVQAYGARRLDEIAKKTQTLRETPAQISNQSSTQYVPAYAYEQPVMPPPPNPSAKI